MSKGISSGYQADFPSLAVSSVDTESFAEYSPSPSQSHRPTPVPKRPKGRLAVSLVLLSFVSFVGYHLWQGWFRFSAYGSVVGRAVSVHPPWDGQLRYLHVREGETVRQGQVLFTIESFQLDHQVLELEDEIRVAQADLEAELARLKWEAQFHSNLNKEAVADYYKAWGTLLAEEAKLEDLRNSLPRAQALFEDKTVSEQVFQRGVVQESGQRKKVEKLADALEVLKERAEVAATVDTLDNGYEQLKPRFVKIEALQGKVRRQRELIELGHVRSRVDGLVVKRHHFVGARVTTDQSIFDVLEDGSLEIVLYIAQDSSAVFTVGSEVVVNTEPHAEALACTVDRLGDSYQQAPNHLKTYYRAQEHLLPVYLKPDPSLLHVVALRMGEMVKLPTHWLDF